MGYNNGVLTALRERWEHPRDYDEHITEYARREHSLSKRQVYNRIRSLAPDQNTGGLKPITPRGHTLIDDVTHNEFPTDEEQALARTLQSINLEPKQGLLLTATEPRTSSKHYKALDRIVNDAHLPHRSTFRNYTATLHDTGMLTEYNLGSAVDVDRTEYKRSKAGTRIGGPAAAGALDHAITHGRSLYDTIGQVAHAGKTNGVYTRARILETIHGGADETSVADIVADIDANRGTIDKHILQLRDNNIVNHPSAESKQKRYQLIDDQDIDSDLIRPFNAHEYVTADILADHADISRSYAKQRLQTLNEQGTLTSPSGQQRSKLTLTWTGDAFTQYIKELRGLINDDDRGNHLRRAYNVLTDHKERRKNHLRRGLELHAEASNNIDQQRTQDRLKQITRTIQDHDEPCTGDIAEQVNLSRQMTSNYLRRLTQRGTIKPTVEQNGKRKRYTLTTS